jgi:uncharacterized protein (TIGR00369 family)
MTDDDHANRTLQRWIEDEERLRGRSANEGFGVAMPRQLANRSGLDILQAMLNGEWPSPPICRTLDFVLIAAEPNVAVFQGTPRFDHYNPLGSVHGGWIATLLDSAVGCAVQTTLDPGRAYTTIELKVNMVRAVTDGIGRVRAEGRVIHVGSRVATAEGRLVGPDGRLYAHGSTTCLLFDAPRSAAV